MRPIEIVALGKTSYHLMNILPPTLPPMDTAVGDAPPNDLPVVTPTLSPMDTVAADADLLNEQFLPSDAPFQTEEHQFAELG